MVLSCGKKLFNLPIGKNAKTDCAPLSKLELISRALNNFKVPNDFDNSLFAHAFNTTFPIRIDYTRIGKFLLSHNGS